MSIETKVLLEKGTGKTASAGEIEIPDLWHIAMALKDVAAGRRRMIGVDSVALSSQADAILKCWHTAHALKQHIIEHE